MARGKGAAIFKKYVLPRIVYAMQFVSRGDRIEFCDHGIRYLTEIKDQMKTLKPRPRKCPK